jgi:uncharacterized protein YbjT (DUF2867 family)
MEAAMVEQAATGRVALVAGATGLVGRAVLAALLADKRYRAVHALGRKIPTGTHPKLQWHQVDFNHLTSLPAADEAYIALGTTIKVAGSQQAFRAVDYDAVLAVAKAARAAGATRLGVVSAMGASARSGIFYNRVKGEMEDAVTTLGYTSVVLARPSFLLGDREALGQPGRAGEGFALTLTRWLRPVLPANYRAVEATQVAKALIRAIQHAAPGTTALLSGDMQA